MARGYGGFSIEYSKSKRVQERVEQEVNALSEEEFLNKYREYDWWRDRKNIYGKYATTRYYEIEQRKYYEQNPEAKSKEVAGLFRCVVILYLYLFGGSILRNSDISPVLNLIYLIGVPIAYFPIKNLIKKVKKN